VVLGGIALYLSRRKKLAPNPFEQVWPPPAWDTDL
jgi:hypothetical protein